MNCDRENAERRVATNSKQKGNNYPPIVLANSPRKNQPNHPNQRLSTVE